MRAPNTMFGQRAKQAVVTAVKNVLASALIVGRNPEQRLREVWGQLMAEPAVQKLQTLSLQSQAGAWVTDPKQLSIVQHALENIKLAIQQHKGVHTEESRKLYQTLLNIITPPAHLRLIRATASLFSLGSRRGLLAAQARVAEVLERIDLAADDEETGMSLFVPGPRKQRMDMLQRELLDVVLTGREATLAPKLQPQSRNAPIQPVV
jgi:hypothetical protein